MLKVHILSRRRADLTHEQYMDHWVNKHVPLYTGIPEVRNYVRHYVQCSLTGDRPEGPNLGETDGIVELWFDDVEAFNAFSCSPTYIDIIRPDEEKFTDPTRCEYFFSEEHTIFE
jgi:uncharacterized protein (TIGR02118 family)